MFPLAICFGLCCLRKMQMGSKISLILEKQTHHHLQLSSPRLEAPSCDPWQDLKAALPFLFPFSY